MRFNQLFAISLVVSLGVIPARSSAQSANDPGHPSSRSEKIAQSLSGHSEDGVTKSVEKSCTHISGLEKELTNITNDCNRLILQLQESAIISYRSSAGEPRSRYANALSASAQIGELRGPRDFFLENVERGADHVERFASRPDVRADLGVIGRIGMTQGRPDKAIQAIPGLIGATVEKAVNDLTSPILDANSRVLERMKEKTETNKEAVKDGQRSVSGYKVERTENSKSGNSSSINRSLQIPGPLPHATMRALTPSNGSSRGGRDVSPGGGGGAGTGGNRGTSTPSTSFGHGA